MIALSDPLDRPYTVDGIATTLALECFPDCRTQDWRKDRIYRAALQLAWLLPGTRLGDRMLAELRALKRLGQIEAEIESAAEIINRYRRLNGVKDERPERRKGARDRRAA